MWYDIAQAHIGYRGKEENLLEIVDNIDAYCKKNNISVKAFERQCGIYNCSVHKWRTGVNQGPTIRTLKKIEAATGIPVSTWIMKGGIA